MFDIYMEPWTDYEIPVVFPIPIKIRTVFLPRTGERLAFPNKFRFPVYSSKIYSDLRFWVGFRVVFVRRGNYGSLEKKFKSIQRGVWYRYFKYSRLSGIPP